MKTYIVVSIANNSILSIDGVYDDREMAIENCYKRYQRCLEMNLNKEHDRAINPLLTIHIVREEDEID